MDPNRDFHGRVVESPGPRELMSTEGHKQISGWGHAGGRGPGEREGAEVSTPKAWVEGQAVGGNKHRDKVAVTEQAAEVLAPKWQGRGRLERGGCGPGAPSCCALSSGLSQLTRSVRLHVIRHIVQGYL